MPTLHFHDDESRSIHIPAPANDPRSYPPSYPPANRRTLWGGESLIAALQPYANIHRSTLDTTLFLIDPSRQDLEAHSAVLFADDAIDSIFLPSSSPIPIHRRPRPLTSPPNANLRTRGTSILHASLSPQYSSSILQSFSNITRSTRHAAQQILSHPLAKPIIPHLPEPVKSLVNANGEWSSWVEKGGLGEFESARVYLAKWAKVGLPQKRSFTESDLSMVRSLQKKVKGPGCERLYPLPQELLHLTMPRHHWVYSN